MSEEYRKCDQQGCEFSATYYYVWTKPQYACFIHAQKALDISAALGFPTVASTMRPLTLEEMMPPKDGDE